MFSGKTLELFRRIHLARLARQKVQIFRSSREDDKNYSQLLSVVCPGVEIFYAEDSYHLLTNFYNSTQVVGIDEVQLFGDSIVKAVKKLAQNGVRVICAGLDLDLLGEPSLPMGELLARANGVDKLSAVCTICGQSASKTSCVVFDKKDKKPDTNIYEARCNIHAQF